MFGKNYIAGEWVSAANQFESRSPEDRRLLGTAASSSAEDVNSAVAAAKKMQSHWSQTPVEKRAEIIARAAEIIRREYGREGELTPLKQLICDEMGKRLTEADIEVLESSDMLSFFAEHGPSCLADRHIALNRDVWPTKQSSIIFEPIGIVGVIKPWNYPLELPLWAIGAALVSGNTVVFKPSEQTPLVGTKITEIFEEAGMPGGVLNLITGDGVVGACLASNSAVDMISFTGSAAVGRELANGCATRLQRVSLELGGKDAMIVLHDADLTLAVNGAVWGGFTNCGQVCVGVRRLIIDRTLKDKFLEQLLLQTLSLRFKKDLGPLVSERQREKLQEQIADALAKGAHILCGGKIPQDPQYQNGYFFEPTILENTTSSMLVEQEDTFGPLMVVKYFDSPDDAVSMANDTHFDLGASVWTNDQKRGAHLACQLKVGMVWVNDVNVAFPQAPWAGRRWSGNGVELSEFSFYEYTMRKHISLEIGSDTRRLWWFPYP